MNERVEPSISQTLLVEVISRLSEIDSRLGTLQGQNAEIMREQQRAADGRKEVYDKINKIPTIEAELARIAPMVDRHEKKHNEAAGAMSLGRLMLAGGGGVFGAIAALVARYLTDGHGAPPHP